MAKSIISQAGITVDSKRVVSGVFTLVGTHGTPLEIILEFFKKENLIVDWCDYVEGALKDGAKIDTVRSRIYAAVGDIYGPQYRDKFIIRFEEFYPELA